MTIEHIRNQINEYEGKIAKHEEEVSKKVISTKKEINAEYSSKFEEALTNYRIKIKKFEKINNKSKNVLTIRKVKMKALKILNKEISNLTKKKNKDIMENLKLINREKINITKKYSKQIKTLKNKLKALEVKKFSERWKKWRHL